MPSERDGVESRANGAVEMKSIHEQLRERYPAPEWAIFSEVANGPGSTTRRYADAIAMSLFPSRGLDIHGFEVKTSRSDWLRELKKPQKAELIAGYCDFWWVVAGDEKVAEKNEVPRNWGLLVSKGDVLRQVKGAERLEPKPLDRKFVAAILRRADEWAKVQSENDARVVAAREAGIEEGKRVSTWEGRQAKEDLEKLTKRLAKFEKASGVQIDNYHGGDIGNAVKAFLWSQKNDCCDDLERTAGWIEDSAKGLRTRVALIKASRPKEVQGDGQPQGPTPETPAGGLQDVQAVEGGSEQRPEAPGQAP